MRAERISNLAASDDGSGPLLRRALREGMLLFGLLALLVLGVIWGAAWSVITLERVAAEENAIHAAGQLLEAYKAQMVRNLGVIDQTLKVVKFAHEFQENRFSLPELSEKGLLPSSVVFDVRVADADGKPIDSSATRNAGDAVDISGRDYFQAHRQFDTGKPYVGDSEYNDATHQWELHFSRRLDNADGSFGGVVVITVDPAYFTSGYEYASLGQHGTIGLLGAKGQVLVLRSGDTTRSGGRPVAIDTQDGATVGAEARLQYDTWDGVDRYTAIEQIPGSQLFAVVGLAEDEQFAEYRKHKRNYLLEAGATSILLILVVGVLSRLMSQLNASRRHMRKIQQTYHAASEGSVDAFYVLHNVIDARGAIVDFRISDVNQQGEKLVGMQKAEMLGRTLTDLFPNVSTNHFLADLIDVARTGTIHEKEWHNDDLDLRADWLYRQVVPVEDGVVTIMRDISERKRLETKVQYQATHDALTGLANRTLLHDRLNQAIAQATRNDKEIWVILVDLDRFKMVNDSLGHKAGDAFLLAVSERLQAIVREADTVARLGGDEFVLILPEAGGNKMSVNSLARIMQTISRPIPVEEKEFSLNCSLGVAVFPSDGETAELLIERADMAMYRAKETGRNNFQFFTAEMNERLIERMRIEEALREAVERQEFELHYQPQVDLATGRVIGAEALIRWRHPEMGLISPARFIPLAEETGLIVPIGHWVLRTACEQTTAWDRAGLSDLHGLRIAVNLSARQFAQPDLVQSIADALRDSGIAPDRLEIELTEGLVMTDVENVIETLHDLKKLGVQLSIDDFGTGYSSLSYLQRFPIDVLKIDQSFVRDITGSSGEGTIVHTIISMAHNLGLRVIAEGVETEAQLAYLKKHECDEMQGFYFSRPLPVKEMEALLRRGRTLDDAKQAV
jgi:diguanylate cyclase (GGDEF)-like protein/PAS domain S-box-containing protein